MAKHTWSKFWWTDWQGDLALKSCSYAARGLWMDMLAIMHASDDEGHFTISGRKVSAKQLAGLSNGTEKEVAKLLIELEENGVYSVNEEGVIYSRRMVRDKAIREQAQRDGKLGGNPDLKAHKPNKVNPGGNGQDNGGVNPPHKASLKLLDTKKLEARSQTSEEETPSLRSVPQNRGTRLPDDWAPSAEEWGFAADLKLSPDAVAAKFCDYWHAKPGAAGRKTDWTATWRNWCRSDAERRKPEREDPMVAVARTMGLFNPEQETFTPSVPRTIQ